MSFINTMLVWPILQLPLCGRGLAASEAWLPPGFQAEQTIPTLPGAAPGAWRVHPGCGAEVGRQGGAQGLLKSGGAPAAPHHHAPLAPQGAAPGARGHSPLCWPQRQLQAMWVNPTCVPAPPSHDGSKFAFYVTAQDLRFFLNSQVCMRIC